MEQSDDKTKDVMILQGEIDRAIDHVENDAKTNDGNMDDSMEKDKSFLTKTVLTLTLYFGFIVTVINCWSGFNIIHSLNAMGVKMLAIFRISV